MSSDVSVEPALRVIDGRPPLRDPAMSNTIDRHDRVRLTSRWIEIDGRPALPVTGEMHYSRVPRERWEEQLRVMAATGLTVVSTYVFWNHHEPERGRIDFTGQLDISEFVRTAARVGIDVIVRIGPWAHGEARNGGHPDWVIEAAPRNRRDDPAYLALVRDWFAALGAQLSPLCGPSSGVVGVQLENELYDQPEHLRTLKRLAREAGIVAPIWTATAWGGAVLPPHEVLPLYGGYADGFWADQGEAWHDSFRDHFRFTHVWDDPGVGSDQRDRDQVVQIRGVDPEFPPATCELGGGMATAYHRRPVVRSADVATIANIKLGNGSAWQGFYMYAGGVNPRDGLQETHATQYPNDLPRFDYDFQAPIGATGRAGVGLGRLREHNTFVASFGEQLVQMFSTLPRDAPVDVHDLDTLRWAVRSDGERGFLFANTHQPYQALSGVNDVQFRIAFDDAELVVPDRPLHIPAGAIMRWPLRWKIGAARLEWATASAIALLPGELATLVLRAHEGIEPRVLLEGGEPQVLPIGAAVVLDDAFRVLVVDDEQAARLWLVDGVLYDCEDILWLESDGRVAVRADAMPELRRWDGDRFVTVPLHAGATPDVSVVELERVRDAGDPPARYGSFMGRSSAPTDADIDEHAAVWRLPALPTTQDGSRVELVVRWEGDVAQLRVDGVPVRDRFWDGLEWRIDLTDVPEGSAVTLHVLPITRETVVDLDDAARERVDAAGRLARVESVERIASVVFHEQ